MALSRGLDSLEEIFIRQTLGETVKVMKQNATFLRGPFTKEA
jgi:hypothetical protein